MLFMNEENAKDRAFSQKNKSGSFIAKRTSEPDLLPGFSQAVTAFLAPVSAPVAKDELSASPQDRRDTLKSKEADDKQSPLRDSQHHQEKDATIDQEATSRKGMASGLSLSEQLPAHRRKKSVSVPTISALMVDLLLDEELLACT